MLKTDLSGMINYDTFSVAHSDLIGNLKNVIFHSRTCYSVQCNSQLSLCANSKIILCVLLFFKLKDHI
jgi:hypothetical protein